MSTAATVTAADITFDKMTTFEGVQECFMVVDGEFVGAISRERSTGTGSRFQTIIGTSGPWLYTVEVEGVILEVKDGANLRDVKKAMIAAYLAR